VSDTEVGTEPTTELERVYRHVGAKLWRSLLAYSADPELASDAVAEAFAQALARGDAIQDVERWVWRTGFRIAAGELHRRRRSPNGTLREATYEIEVPARQLIDALIALPTKQRAAVVLHHAADYPIREVALILDSTPGAVKVHLARGRRRLRGLLGDEADA
jgi:RNA polymerase sigma-70 factor (ECF subfamily)